MRWIGFFWMGCLGVMQTCEMVAEVTLAQIFTDHMVLQRNQPIKVWGQAEADESIRVSLADQSFHTRANSQGKWLVELAPLEAGGPHQLTVAGQNQITLEDVLVGEVWICSGQSNMEMGVAHVDRAEEAIGEASFPGIRLFTVDKATSLSPRDRWDNDPSWVACSPETLAQGGWGGFSATAYFFGRALHQSLGIPIGLIHASWGGTLCEAWTSAEGLRELPDFAPAVESVQRLAEEMETGRFNFEGQMQDWWQQNDPGDRQRGNWANPDIDTSQWTTMDVPGHWEKAGLEGFDGIVWFRKVITLPDDWQGENLILHLGPIDDADTTFVNGMEVGTTDFWMAGRTYPIQANWFKAGMNTVSVRVLDTGGDGGFYGAPDQLRLENPERKQSLSLAGNWQYRVARSARDWSPLPQRPGNNPNVTTVLYNAMLAPIIPFTIRGAIWYQGESNAGRAYQYRSLFPAMIRDWRQQWQQGDFPFGFVQLANFTPPQSDPGESSWAELREAQSMALSEPNTGQAVIIDIGDAADIHPRNKQDVGARLALWAKSEVYHQNLVYSGPTYRSMQIEGNRIRLTFDHAGSGLRAGRASAASNQPLRSFAIAGKDRQFVWAEARIDGASIVVSSKEIEEPVAVRYAWADNPEGCNLYNQEGLPASPFRTDDWPGITVGGR